MFIIQLNVDFYKYFFQNLMFFKSDMEIMNVYFFSEVNFGFFYKSVVEREKLVQVEREFIDERVRKIIVLKK